jgi:hypothetical protein
MMMTCLIGLAVLIASTEPAESAACTAAEKPIAEIAVAEAQAANFAHHSFNLF